MITATGLELRAGARILLEPTTLRVQKGDRIGLVGRNGAGKTTSLRVLAGESLPHAGAVERTGPVGYLPQDPRTGDLDTKARDRVLSARGLDVLASDIAKIQIQLAETPDEIARRIEKAEKKLGEGRVKYVHPDCGFWMLKRSVADRKIEALAKGRDRFLGR